MATTERADKTTIGLTGNGRVVMTQLMAKSWFGNQMDAAKFALAVAINAGVSAGQAEGADTTWNVGGFDPTQELRTVIPLIVPETQTPYRLVEHYLNAGLGIIGEKLAADPYLELVDLMRASEG